MSQCETPASLSWLDMRAGPKKAFVTRASYYPFALSITRSTTFFTLPTAWSRRPSFLRRSLSVTTPAASLTRPLVSSVVPLIATSSCQYASRVDAFCPGKESKRSPGEADVSNDTDQPEHEDDHHNA